VVANCITIAVPSSARAKTWPKRWPSRPTAGQADIELQPLSAINSVLDRLEHGRVASRVVIDFTAG